MENMDTMFGGDAEEFNVPETVEETQTIQDPVVEQPPVVEKPAIPDGYVPVSVVKELRDEIRSLKTPPPAQTMPEEELYPDEDTLKIVRAENRNQTMQISQTLAEDKFGSDVVKTAFEWAFERCNSDPAFNMAVAQSSHPYKLIVEEHRKAQSLQELGNVDPEQIKAFKQWQAAQNQIPATIANPTPPRSIASHTSAGEPTQPKVSPEEQRLAKMF